MIKKKVKVKPKAKIFGEIDLWDFVDKEGLREHLEISDDDWDNYGIVFRITDKGGSGFAEVIGW